jgi:phospholipase D-like protein
MFDDNTSFLLATFEFFIFCAWFMCLFWIIGDVFRSKDLGAWGKTGWTLFLIFLPIVAMLVYMIVRGGGMSDRALESRTDALERQDAYIRRVAASDAGPSTATDQIVSAKSLLDSGAIDEVEFLKLKSEALGTATARTA